MEISTNGQLRAKARQALSGKWTQPVLITLIYMAILAPFISTNYVASIWKMYTLYGGSYILMLLVSLPLGYGLFVTFLNFMRGGDAEARIEDLFIAFKANFGKIFGTMLLMTVYTMLWSLLLVIPGIIKSYSYAMTPYLLADYPDVDSDKLIEQSMAMMEGNKMRLFMLDLSFLGWGILASLTCCIGFLWLMPYMYSARAQFYIELKEAAMTQQQA